MLQTLKTIVVATWNGFFDNRLTSMAAAIAFYALFSVGPILLVAITIADPILGHMAAEEAIMSGLSEALGVENLEVIRRAVQEGLFRGGSTWTTIVSVGVILYSGTAIFVELDSAFDVIWGPGVGWRRHPVLAEIRSRLLALGLMAVIGVLFILVFTATATIAAYDGVLRRLPWLGQYLGSALSEGWSLGVTAGFFALIYKFLPDVPIPWRFALISGAVVAVLFLIGNSAIAWYFAHSVLASAFGAAGALAAVMVWVYYSAIIVLVAGQVGRATRDALEVRGAEGTEGEG
ncbi:YihY/virulence factor BrkB family protein [Vineibacter terrae]|uniref:YihY/virulence factor BrkB family protein n=1 Tax=Vineibacter terrae TaxID=2586908 RepID=A0A5C8PAB5_9HYPH|nr:YihY/virulence factor BrkB family protein [Vineibacter terrae]TXL70181.1 YihY/virulence factor BrkB family protein [Vineibacter terrae]